MDDEPAKQLMVHGLPSTRSSDTETDTYGLAPAVGLSQAFDSLDATMRLAAQTGVAEELQDYATTQKMKLLEKTIVRGTVVDTSTFDLRSPLQLQQQEGWSRRDKQIFAVSVAAALIIAAAIVLT